MLFPMKFQKNPVYGFTSRATQKVNVLSNEIHISEACDLGVVSPQPVKKPFMAIWDTGASATVISKNVINGLGLQPSGRATVQVIGADDSTREYETHIQGRSATKAEATSSGVL